MDYTISGVVYTVIDAIEKISSKDSFTATENKLGRGRGAWEWHIGSKNDAAKYAFFDGPGFDVQCFVQKADLLWLMTEMEAEYTNPSQNYRDEHDFPQVYQDRINEINALPDRAFFKFREHDGRDPADRRLYAKRPGSIVDGDGTFGLLRKLILPNITFTSILKLQSGSGRILYYFKVFPEFSAYDFDSIYASNQVAAINASLNIGATEKDQLVKSRIGQGRFRNGIFVDINHCPVTLVDDSRLLIASHIKPWSVSTNNERLDSKNGLLLTPTLDKLFDSGLISFGDDKILIISPWIAGNTIRSLGLAAGTQYPTLPVTGREQYLAYHRQHVFKS